jgi:succinate dehydrogenase / fumarate reductase cytochrome b subunit
MRVPSNPGFAMAERPTSPHLTIWRWGPGMLVSILHRITGDGLALVGLPVLLWWLGSLAAGPEAYETFAAWMWPDLAALDWEGEAILISLLKVLLKLVMVGLSWAFFSHLCSGIRHFALDMGAGFEVRTNERWSVGTIIGAILLTAAFWAVLLVF